ncbi:MAG: hypothetical protein HY773_00120 [Candidatus Terrybacteria bacterium]|nr:hypothetical protein [Candidatus Terrybacteria bacterium]
MRKRSKKEWLAEALRSLKDEGFIPNFMTFYSAQKPDFYLTYISKITNAHKFCPLSMTEISFQETQDSIKKQILNKIAEKEQRLL